MNIARRGFIALAVLVGVAVASMPATADGGPPRGYAADQVVYPSIWQGLYAGVHVGIPDGNGVLGGAQLGYNWQSGRIVYGAEADIAGSSLEDDNVRICMGGCITVKSSLDWFATVRGRVGYLIDPRILAYATAGVGIASWSTEINISPCPFVDCGGFAKGRETDFVYGLGVEGKISETMSARLEFLSSGDDVNVDVVRAGLNFKLGN